jgi:hypothetical protein
MRTGENAGEAKSKQVCDWIKKKKKKKKKKPSVGLLFHPRLPSQPHLLSLSKKATPQKKGNANKRRRTIKTTNFHICFPGVQHRGLTEQVSFGSSILRPCDHAPGAPPHEPLGPRGGPRTRPERARTGLAPQPRGVKRRHGPHRGALFRNHIYYI